MTAVLTTIDGPEMNYDTVLFFSLVEEDGQLKVLEIKDFADPEERSAFHSEAARVVAREGLVA